MNNLETHKYWKEIKIYPENAYEIENGSTIMPTALELDSLIIENLKATIKWDGCYTFSGLSHIYDLQEFMEAMQEFQEIADQIIRY